MHTEVGSVQPNGRRDTWPEDHVYVGMPCNASRAFGIPDAEGVFGKPWEFSKQPIWPALFSNYMAQRLLADAKFAEQVKALHGKTLLCWCTAKADRRGEEVRCHARILAEYVELLFHAKK